MPPVPDNLGFETPGGAPGLARGWQVRSQISVGGQMRAGFRRTGAEAIPSPNALGAAFWTPVNVLVTSDVAADPNGGTTADRLRDDAVAGYHRLDSDTLDLVADGRYVFGFFVKAETCNFAGPGIDVGGANHAYVKADLLAGRIDYVSPPIGAVRRVSGTIVNLPSGWHLVTMHVEMAADATIRFAVALSDGSDNPSYAGALQTVLAWGVFVHELDLLEVEDFDAWVVGYASTLVDGVTSTDATFKTSMVSTHAYEDFETAWSNYPYVVTGAPGTAVIWDGDIFGPVETWTPDYAYITSGGTTASATWDQDGTPENAEDFAEKWSANESYVTSGGTTVSTTWDNTGSENAEDFEEVVADVEYVVDATTDTFTANAHGLTDGTRVIPVNVGGAYPGGLIHTLRHYVVGATANTFQLSLTNGGAPVNITDAGTGTNIVRGDPSRYWNTPDINPTI